MMKDYRSSAVALEGATYIGAVHNSHGKKEFTKILFGNVRYSALKPLYRMLNGENRVGWTADPLPLHYAFQLMVRRFPQPAL